MTPAAAYTAMGLTLAGCVVYIAGGPGRIRAAIIRARWAWRCRPRWRYRGRPPLPARDEDPLDRYEMRVFVTVILGWDRPAPAERSRT